MLTVFLRIDIHERNEYYIRIQLKEMCNPFIMHDMEMMLEYVQTLNLRMFLLPILV